MRELFFNNFDIQSLNFTPMLQGLLHTHSLLRYILLILILIAIAKALSGWLGKKSFTERTRKINLITLILAHIQLVIGLTLYFLNGWHTKLGNMKNPTRFWTIEHLAMMLIAIALITVGYSFSKKGKTDEAKHKRIAIFFLIALLVIFYAIPWPWSAVARGWMPGM